MKVYFIYLHGIDSFSPWLYAITDNKKLKDSFIYERKKDMFISKKKEMTKEEYKLFSASHSGHVLGRRGFETKSSSSLSRSEIVYLTSTNAEESSVYTKEEEIFSLLGKNTDESAIFFKPKLLDALNMLHYFESMKFENIMTMRNDYFLEGVNHLKQGEYRMDYFGVFMYLYGKSIDIKAIIKT